MFNYQGWEPNSNLNDTENFWNDFGVAEFSRKATTIKCQGRFLHHSESFTAISENDIINVCTSCGFKLPMNIPVVHLLRDHRTPAIWHS